jgi:hypothetical protein
LAAEVEARVETGEGTSSSSRKWGGKAFMLGFQTCREKLKERKGDDQRTQDARMVL